MSLISWAKTAFGCLTMLTSTGTRGGLGVGLGVGAAIGATDGPLIAGTPLAAWDGAGVSSPASDVSGGSVTRTVSGAERSGTGPARKRSTLATARSNSRPAPNTSFETSATADDGHEQAEREGHEQAASASAARLGGHRLGLTDTIVSLVVVRSADGPRPSGVTAADPPDRPSGGSCRSA